MDARLENVESTLLHLKNEVVTSNGRQERALFSMQEHAEQMRVDAEQMRVDAEQMRVDAEQMRVDAEQMRGDADKMRGDAEEMRRDKLHNTAVFDQSVALVLDNLAHYRRAVGVVVEHLTTRSEHVDLRQDALEARVKAIEDRLAG
jgi:hypothetical protein